ncbi:hypothetical protein N7509_003609 [Penicillium cosmopolitanum]|uniref:Mannosyl phosphorylinositol ceramide synthase SUR1 n=1 Tax=Penicillium cosmopolitanum TaxID=1131564 RepID=A0A9X0BBM2_9EURO|nr:uncharacterized protein N7509_003609 [Penicillium cosmopolitanum]KAJ5403738.1 hypothetical protein N7509_003609 [Penicillium cosmopolitanum]
MRRGLSIFLLACFLGIVLLVRNIWTLLSLLVEDATADAIHRAELPSLNSSLIDQRPQIIPKIIHQTYKDKSIPDVWFGAQKSCIDLHPDYEYILWTDEKSRNFIAAKYPWFLKTFDAYKYPIQRADSIRYFVLAYYGGTYIDLDDGCNRRLDPLLAYPAWLRRTVPTGISNDAMGSVPQHPFFLRVIELLQQYDRDWPLPYITVMYSTGPLFLSVIWKEYIQDPPSEANRIRVLMQDEYKKHPWSFFTHHVGNSWHGNDAQLIFWMGQHWMLLTFCGILLAFAVGCCLLCAYGRIVRRGIQYRYSYSKVPFFSERYIHDV